MFDQYQRSLSPCHHWRREDLLPQGELFTTPDASDCVARSSEAQWTMDGTSCLIRSMDGDGIAVATAQNSSTQRALVSRLHPPATATATGLRGIPAVILGKRLTEGCPVPGMRVTIINLQRRRQKPTAGRALNSMETPMSLRSSSDATLQRLQRCPHRGKTLRRKNPLRPARVVLDIVRWSRSLVLGRAVSTQTTRVSALARRPRRDPSCQHPCRDASEET